MSGERNTTKDPGRSRTLAPIRDPTIAEAATPHHVSAESIGDCCEKTEVRSPEALGNQRGPKTPLFARAYRSFNMSICNDACDIVFLTLLVA